MRLFVEAGSQIGTLTVTGPHLDWRMSWFDERIDPVLVAGEMPKPGQ